MPKSQCIKKFYTSHISEITAYHSVVQHICAWYVMWLISCYETKTREKSMNVAFAYTKVKRKQSI